MKLKTNDSVLAGAKLVFLDTADWSEMEKGSAASDELRAHCEAGTARILVTPDHLLEVGGLTNGLEPRLAFMRTFPGAVLVVCGGSQMIKLAAYAFAHAVFGQEMPPQQFVCKEMRTESMAALIEMVDETRMLRRVQGYSARTTSSVRAREKATSREEREMNEKFHRSARKGMRRQCSST